MDRRFLFGFALLAAGLGGCASKNASQVTRLAQNQAEEDQIRNEPISAQTHYAAGLLAESRGDFTNALAQYKYSLAVDNSFNMAMFRIGCVYAEMHRYPESIETWEKYVRATNESAVGYSNLAYTEELAGNPEGAEKNYKLGIAKDPSNEPCRINYGLMLARHRRVGEAVIQLQAVLTPAEVHYNIASVYELEHRPEMAKLEYQQALALDPNFADAREKLASLNDPADGD